MRVCPTKAIFMECDVQGKFAKHIKNFDAVATNSGRLAQIAKVFEIPVVATHQINFGPIAEQVSEHHHEGVKTFEKAKFSMLDEQVSEHMQTLKPRNQAILYGLETQVCIRQTALDLLEQDYDVHLVVDAVSSISHHDRNIAIESLRDSGCMVVSFQALLFEMLRHAKHPNFKACLPIVKGNPEM